MLLMIPMYPLAHYFMGRALHLNYCFGDAAKAYKKFLSLASTKDIDAFEVKKID